ncbi:hypothetical protein HPPN135_07110 [Helicobacter pylori Puno135]|nr:hypothetical protein HPPN135_05220 [Helicobacter pylori Puno135]AEN19085.1 hypothetical protein HPPN135_07110 [Helicobacter pylori Puno135]
MKEMDKSGLEMMEGGRSKKLKINKVLNKIKL